MVEASAFYMRSSAWKRYADGESSRAGNRKLGLPDLPAIGPGPSGVSSEFSAARRPLAVGRVKSDSGRVCIDRCASRVGGVDQLGTGIVAKAGEAGEAHDAVQAG